MIKHRLFSRSIALLVVFGLLLTGSILPVAATSISDAVGSSSNLILNDDFRPTCEFKVQIRLKKFLVSRILPV